MSQPNKALRAANVIERSLGENNKFRCYACPDNASFSDWNRHISNQSHIKSLRKYNATFATHGIIVKCKLCGEFLDRPRSKSHGKFRGECTGFDNYEQYFNESIHEWQQKFYCNLCSAVLLNHDNVLKHINDLVHKSAKKHYIPHVEWLPVVSSQEVYRDLVSEGFGPCDPTTLTCHFCQIDVKFDKKEEHVEGLDHRNFKIRFLTLNHMISAAQESRVVSQEKKVELEQSEPSGCKAENPSFSGDFTNQPCKANFEATECNFCSIIFISGAELHAHMAGHFVMDFVGARVDKKPNHKKNSRSGKSKEDQKNIAWPSCALSPIVPQDNLHSYQNCNEINDISPISNSSVIIASTCALAKISAVEGDAKVQRDNSISPDQKNNDSNANDISSLSKLSSITSWGSSNSEDEYSNASETSQEEDESKKMTMRKMIKLLNFNKDMIYDMRAKKDDIELGIELSLISNAGEVYCMICRETITMTPSNYFEHLSDLMHGEYLEDMKRDHELFEVVRGQRSDLDLAREYIEDISDEIVECHVCKEEIANNDCAITKHIEKENHELRRDKNRARSKKYFKELPLRMKCDWYNIANYWCVPCGKFFDNEVDFTAHSHCENHYKVISDVVTRNKTLMLDFCASCGLLWYGYRCTYSYHCDTTGHKWLLRDGHYFITGLSQLAKNLLAHPKKFIDDTFNYLDSVAANERARQNCFIKDLKDAVKVKFPGAKAHVYGSRVSGLSAPERDINVFLDCGYGYNRSFESEDLVYLMKQVNDCLMEDVQKWDVNGLLTECRSPFIRLNHRPSGLTCDISVENGLPVESTKLIKCFNEVCPPCRELTLFLKQWLVSCNLSGTERISSYALCWFVIFYLQQELILPSIATLISMKKMSKTVAGWEVGVTYKFSYNECGTDYTLKERLIRFFKFYTNFDFRHNVVCPLLGEEISKRAFVDPGKLPKEMGPYIAYTAKSADREPLRIDAVACVQDPFDLRRNITEDVSKVYIYRFRTSCLKSLDVLCYE